MTNKEAGISALTEYRYSLIKVKEAIKGKSLIGDIAMTLALNNLDMFIECAEANTPGIEFIKEDGGIITSGKEYVVGEVGEISPTPGAMDTVLRHGLEPSQPPHTDSESVFKE